MSMSTDDPFRLSIDSQLFDTVFKPTSQMDNTIPLLKDKIAEIERLLAAATPGPWFIDFHGYPYCVYEDGTLNRTIFIAGEPTVMRPRHETGANLCLAATAHNTMSLLIAEIRRLWAAAETADPAPTPTPTPTSSSTRMDNPKLYRVVHTRVPYVDNSPQSMLVEAESREGAYALAYDTLNRTGHIVCVSQSRLLELQLDIEQLVSLGVSLEILPRITTNIQTVDEYIPVTAKGRVIWDNTK